MKPATILWVVAVACTGPLAACGESTRSAGRPSTGGSATGGLAGGGGSVGGLAGAGRGAGGDGGDRGGRGGGTAGCCCAN
jgi:hypothetical protein